MPNLNPRFTAGVVVWLIGSLNVAWIYSYSEKKKLLKMEAGSPSRGESSRSIVAQETTIQMDGLMPQLFTSMPSLNEAASLLAQTTSYFTGCFSDFSVEPSPRERQSLLDGQELQTFPSGQNARHLVRDHLYAGELSSSSSATSPFPDTMTRRTSADSSQNTTAIVASSSGGNGISLFQGLVERARRTVRGSADDIGWLKRDPGLPPAEDGTERFMTILDNIRHGVHQLPSSIVYLLVPGLFSNHGPMYFVNTKSKFSKMGLTCHIAKIHSESSVEKNAREIKDYIEEIYWGSNKRVMLLGHSKGGIDSAAALSLYWPELKDKVAGLVIAQSPYGGTPVASDILREGQLGDYVSLRKLMEIVICKVIKGDMQALEDLTYDKRKEFLRKHELPRELAVVSFHTEAGITPAVIATLSHVAHAELPSVVSSEAPTKLPVVIPLGAAMAACAQLIQIRYGEKSDGLVTRCDAEVPGSLAVRPTRKLDHAWMVYSSLKDDTAEANAAEVCEALLTLLVEKERREGDGEKQD